MEKNNWKSYVDWWPTYWFIGISMAYFIHKSGVIQPLIDKLLTKKDESEG